MADEVVVVRLALFSRILVLFLQVVYNFLITDYDSSSTVGQNNTKPLDKAVIFIFDGFQKWDSVYFLQIAKDGYQYEQFMAFFPLYPWLVRTISLPLHIILGDYLDFRSILLVVGWLISCIFFCLAAVFLYKLSVEVMKDKCLAFNSCVVFCINPATIFMSTAYTESLFAGCLFAGLYYLETSNSVINTLTASLLFCLGGASRSNGIISYGFVIHRLLKTLISHIFIQIIPVPKLHQSWKSVFYALFVTGFKATVSLGIIVLPFVGFQLYGYSLFCTHFPSKGHEREVSPWCSWSLPFSYSYIQHHYWNVGFLKYFEVKQIPNFILASPMVILSLMAAWEFIGDGRNSLTVKTMGLWQQSTTKSKCGFHSPDIFVYIAHMVFLIIFGITSIHVQVLTRLISSSCPVIYWYTSHLVINNKGSWESLVLGYFVTYFCIGIILHCNFYPWT